ncbi:hypothetical protein [Streptomyces sp. NPDC093111]|uniref:hypothetical protein n=1 Tax=Streptomyces sp. NPDC093111 TaxID=3154978 RepID=UPI003412930C
MTEQMELGRGTVPDYPPKTPPPPKKPVELPRPDPKDPQNPRPDRRAAVMRNRRGVNWPFESAPWVAGRASSRVLDQLTAWRFRLDDSQRAQVDQVVRTLVAAAVQDGGKRISVHLADKAGAAAAIAVYSHDATPGPPSAPLALADLRAAGVSDCGAETDLEGRYHWAVYEVVV